MPRPTSDFRCQDCEAPARNVVDGRRLCDGCANRRLAALSGWPDLQRHLLARLWSARTGARIASPTASCGSPLGSWPTPKRRVCRSAKATRSRSSVRTTGLRSVLSRCSGSGCVRNWDASTSRSLRRIRDGRSRVTSWRDASRRTQWTGRDARAGGRRPRPQLGAGRRADQLLRGLALPPHLRRSDLIRHPTSARSAAGVRGTTRMADIPSPRSEIAGTRCSAAMRATWRRAHPSRCSAFPTLRRPAPAFLNTQHFPEAPRYR